MFNEKTRKVMLQSMDKGDRLAKKYGVKSLGSWAVPNEHTGYEVYEAPSLEAMWNFGTDPVNLARGQFEKAEIKVAISFEEVAQMLKHIR
jgi:hypothetical protein